MQTTKPALVSLMVWALTSSSAFAGTLLVPGAEDGAARAALATAGDLGVAAPAATLELINAASASGLSCAGADIACWQQLAALGGHQTAVVVTDTAVIVAAPASTTTAPRLVPGAAGLGPAVRRAFLQRAALQLGVDVAAAVISVDGAVVAGPVVDDLAPGPHTVAVTADGYTPLSTTIELSGGAVERPVLALVPLAAPSSGPSPLLVAGVVTLGVGGAVALGAMGYAGYNELQSPTACHSKSTGPCDEARTGWLLAIGGGAVGLVGLGLTGLALQQQQ